MRIYATMMDPEFYAIERFIKDGCSDWANFEEFEYWFDNPTDIFQYRLLLNGIEFFVAKSL